MKFYWLALGILAVWRITHLLQAEDGPWDIVVRLRRFAGDGFWGKLLDCFYCLSLWVSAPMAWGVGETWGERVFLWLSFSSGAILLQEITVPKVPPAPFVEEPGEENGYVVLRPKAESSHAPGDAGAPER